MIAALFRNNNSLLAWGATLVFGSLLLTLSFLAQDQFIELSGSNRLFEQLIHLPQAVLVLINLLCVVVPAILLNELFRQLKVNQEQHNLFAIAYLLCAFTLLEWTSFNPALLAGALFALILRNLMVVSNSPRQLQLIFDAGLLASICFLIYKPALVLFPVTLFGILLGGVFRLRALLVWLLGYFTPVYLAAAILYLSGQWDLFYNIIRLDDLPVFHAHMLSTGQKIAIAISLSMLFFGFVLSFGSANLKTNTLRNTQRLFSIMLVCGLLSIFLLPSDGWFLACLFVPIASFFLGRFLEAIGPGWMLDLLILSWGASLLWGAGIL